MAIAALPDEAKLLRNFSRCQDWEQRYLYMMELGERLPPLTDEQRTAANFIEGCQSQVWKAVSYTHLTLPTNREVETSVGAA